ncbi:MAG: phosphoribosyltransferase [Spirochaetales bacterium]|nr:phosphoribosyltransferase [Spirochaetales bacterium]
MEDKLYFTYQQIHKLVQKIIREINTAGYSFDVIVAIGTGGFIPARIVKTYINRPIFTVGIQYYNENNKPAESPKKIQWIDEVERKLKGKKILLVDEIDDSRTTLVFCLNELLRHDPAQVAIAVIHNKIKTKNADFPQKILYFCGSDVENKWVVYPWSALDIDEHDRLAYHQSRYCREKSESRRSESDFAEHLT